MVLTASAVAIPIHSVFAECPVGTEVDCAVFARRANALKSVTAPFVSACVANHNGEEVLPATLGALAADLGPGADVIIVDDASTDGSVGAALQAMPGARIVRQATRRGPAAARNVAARLATQDLLLFLDSDMQVAPGCVAALAEALSADPLAAAAMPCVLHAARPDVVQYDGAGAHPLGLMTLENAERLAGEIALATRAIGSIVSSCLLVDRRKLAALLGPGTMSEPFDPEFGIYLEDHNAGRQGPLAGDGPRTGGLLPRRRRRRDRAALDGAPAHLLSITSRGRERHGAPQGSGVGVDRVARAARLARGVLRG